jgi:serine protease Do
MRILGVREARGAAVVEARPGSPAGRAGLESGDVIVGVNGRDVGNAADFAQAITALPPGATARLSVIRNGQGRTVNLTVGALPEPR